MTSIPRPIKIVKGWKKIAQEFGKSQRTVQKWQKNGAPIFFRDGAWMCEISEVWEWLKDPGAYNQSAA